MSKRTPMKFLTLARTCGDRWPALMPVCFGAAYVGISEYLFRKMPEFSKLIMTGFDGRETVAKIQLDEIALALVEKHTQLPPEPPKKFDRYGNRIDTEETEA